MYKYISIQIHGSCVTIDRECVLFINAHYFYYGICSYNGWWDFRQFDKVSYRLSSNVIDNIFWRPAIVEQKLLET